MRDSPSQVSRLDADIHLAAAESLDLCAGVQADSHLDHPFVGRNQRIGGEQGAGSGFPEDFVYLARYRTGKAVAGDSCLCPRADLAGNQLA